MIVYDLKCSRNHVFEAWFPDSASFEAQAEAGKVTCPTCGSRKVAKALMAPNIAARRELSSSEQQAAAKATLALLHKMRDEVEKNCDYVGENFAEEARRIHYGEAEKRNIYGEATQEETDEMVEEGVEFAQIPWLPRRN